MEFRIQTYLFMLVTMCCSFFSAGCGAYHVEEEAGGENAGGPYGMGVEVSNAHLLLHFILWKCICWINRASWPVKNIFPFRRNGPRYSRKVVSIHFLFFLGFLLPTYLQWCWMPSNFSFLTG